METSYRYVTVQTNDKDLPIFSLSFYLLLDKLLRIMLGILDYLQYRAILISI